MSKTDLILVVFWRYIDSMGSYYDYNHTLQLQWPGLSLVVKITCKIHRITMKAPWNHEKQPMKDDNQQIYQVCDYSITIINLKKATTGIKKVPSCTGQCHFHWRSPGKVGTFQVVIFQNTAQGVEFTWRRLGGSSFFRYFFFENVCFLRKLSGWIPRKWTGNGWGGLRV